MGEVLHAQSVGCPPEKIIFDSPCKTRADLSYALRNGVHVNIDNLDELQRVIDLTRGLPADFKLPSVGIRLNPMCGAGSIAALSASVPDSKFGVPIPTHEEELLAAYEKYPWLNCVHVHVGSGAMGTDVLVAGIKTAVDFALRVNQHVGRRQVTIMDIGGGLAADYCSDVVPDHFQYANDLRAAIPGLLCDVNGGGNNVAPLFDRVITEFGQSLNAKSGWLASRIEYLKATADNAAQIAVVHFGAHVSVRQCYTQEHQRRLKFFDDECSHLTKARAPRAEDTSKPQGDSVVTHVAGPLCFQGDFVAKSIEAP